MSTIATTTNTTPFVYPATTLMDREVDSGVDAGYLYCLVKASTADNYTVYRSVNQGSSWASYATFVRAGVVELGAIFVHGGVWLTYRVSESSTDKIYIRQLNVTSGTFGTEFLAASAANGGVAGAVFNGGIDIGTVGTGFGYVVVLVAVGITVGAQHGIELEGSIWPISGSPYQNNSIFSGPRRYLYTGSGRVSPSMELEHGGGIPKGSNVPHMWLSFGRSQLYMAKLAWNGNGWNTPASAVLLNGSAGAQDSITARWDGSRWMTALPVADAVVIYERNKANSTTTTRISPAHPAGVVRNCSLSYNAVSYDFRVYAVGTSSTVLYFVDFVRATGLWTSWGTVSASSILGTTGNNYGVRRSSFGNAKYDVYYAVSGSPNTLTHTQQALSYAPNTPTWASPVSGGAADVATGLLLDWIFSDPDTADTQSAYAVSRQIGAGSLTYWRASDSTWQATEQKNTSGSTSLTLPASWAAGSDAAHTFKVKVWDSADLASAYSAGLIVVPSVKVNPVITAPSGTITTDSTTATWTAAEQTQYRVTLGRSYLDTFSRSASSGWGTADTGQTYTTSGGSAADYSVASGQGKHSHGSVNVTRRTLASGSRTDSYDWFQVIIPVLATGATIAAARLARWTDSSNHYQFRLEFAVGGTQVTIRITKVVAGVETTIAGPTVVGTYGAGSAYDVETQIAGSVLRCRAWNFDTPAPTAWTLEVADTAFASGTYGFSSILFTGNTNTLPVVLGFDNLISADTPTPEYDSGWTNDATARAHTPPVVLPDLTTWVVGLTTRNLEGLASDLQAVAVAVDYVEPMVPTLVATPIPASGYISVAITNPTPGGGAPALADQDLYRRVVGDTSDGVRVGAGLASGATAQDWRAASGVSYQYRVLARGTNGTSIYGAWTT